MTARRLIAAIVAGIALLASPGIALADGHNIPDPDATWGKPDGAESRGQSILPAVQSYITSSYPADPSWPGSGWGVAD